MDVTMLLADYAEAVNNKLYVSGGGWTISGGQGRVARMALAIKIEVPWIAANERHKLHVLLVDQDGKPVELDEKRVEAMGEFEVGRPPGIPAGTPIDVALAFNFQDVPLPAGSYRWEFTIDGQVLARRSFMVIRTA